MLANNHWRDVGGDLPQRDCESPRDSHCSLSEFPTANMDYADYYSAQRGVPEWAWWCFLDILSCGGHGWVQRYDRGCASTGRFQLASSTPRNPKSSVQPLFNFKLHVT